MNNETEKIPLVTVAIPTFERPELLRRALNSLALQDYPNIEVIVSDNCSSAEELQKIEIEFKKKLQKFKFIKQEKNIGPINNFFYCLSIASGDFFMWLADDDEIIGCGYVTHLVNILMSRSDVVTACAKWRLMVDPSTGFFQTEREYANKFWFLRACKFFWFAKDDFFYALHRVGALRKADFVYFSWPNKDSVENLVYPFLLDLVLQGKVVYDHSGCAVWVNHDYTEKSYISSCSTCKSVFKYISRKINIHYIYLLKIANKNFFFFPLFLVYSLLILFKEYVFLFVYIFLHCFKKYIK